jgi:hypothetical protein
MRILMVFLMAASGVRAQVTPSADEALKKAKEKVEALKAAPPKVCAIPLLPARPSPPVDPKMVIAPKGEVQFHIVEVTPPAPPCGAANVRWK